MATKKAPEQPRQQAASPQTDPQAPAQYAQQPPTDWQAIQQQQGPEGQSQQPQAPHQPVTPVTWQSSEYIAHAKTSKWYALFSVGTLVVTVIIYLLTKEILSSITIFVVGVSAGFFAARPPSMRGYEINEHELKIDDKIYPLENFKSFSVVEEGAKDSIWLKPVKRFAQFQIVYFNPEDEQRIIDILGVLLPHEERELDRLDLITKKLRF